MSDTGQPSPILLVLLDDANDQNSLFRQELSNGGMAVCVFTRTEICNEYGSGFRVPLYLDNLRSALTEQKGRGCTHVIVDPVKGSDARSMLIDEFLADCESSV